LEGRKEREEGMIRRHAEEKRKRKEYRQTSRRIFSILGMEYNMSR